MFELLAGFGLKAVEFGAPCLYSCLLCLDGRAGRFHFVACSLVLALLLVQLQFALLQLGVALVGLRLAPGSLPFGLGADFHGLLASFELARALEVVGFALGVGYDFLGACACHAALCHDCGRYGHGGGEHYKGYRCYKVECHMVVFV